MFIKRMLLRVLPLPRHLYAIARMLRLALLLYVPLRAYALWYETSIQALIDWHKSELLSNDWEYRFHDAQRRLIIARERARERGVRPLDPEYPDLQDFLKP